MAKKSKQSEDEKTPKDPKEEPTKEEKPESTDAPTEPETPESESTNETDVETEPANGWHEKFVALDRKKKISIIAAPVLIVVLLLFLTVRPLRIFALNLFSNTDITIHVIDADNETPLSGVSVTLDGMTEETDSEGNVTFLDQKYADYEVMLSKNSYESLSGEINATQSVQTFDFALNPTGTSVSVRAVNWLTGDAITTFSVTDESGEINALSDEEGEVLVNVPNGTESIELMATSDGYNQRSFTVDLLDEDGNQILEEDLETEVVRLVKAGRHHFLSNREGPISLWAANYDGSDARAVVDDLGKRRGSLSMRVSPDGKFAVLAAPIKGERNDNGTLLDELYVVNLETSEIRLADEGNARFNILEVENDRVVYHVELLDNNQVNRGKIKTYTISSDTLNTAFTTNYITNARFLENRVIFVENKQEKRTSSYYSEGFYWGTTSEKLFVLDLADDSFTSLVNSYARVVLNPENKDSFFYRYWDNGANWFEYNVNSTEKTELEREPESINELVYRFNDPAPDGRQLWVETRDGDGTLVLGNSDGGDGQSIDTGELAVDYVVRWIDNDHVIVNGTEESGKSGDFVVHVGSGEHRLVSEIYTNTYYYRHGYYGY